MPEARSKAPAKPYDAARLERSALHYVERYATTRAKLIAYLRRKLRERGWTGDEPAPVESIADRFCALGYVNDAVFAEAKAHSLLRRGYGKRRIDAGLRAAGISEAVRDGLREDIDLEAERSALAFARRRRIGPFSRKTLSFEDNRKALAAMLRAGHDIDMARRILGGSYTDEDFPIDEHSPDVDSA